MLKKNTTIVYWSPVTTPDKQTYVNLLWKSIKQLTSVMPSGSEDAGSYRRCVAAVQGLRNTYTFLHPISSTVNLSGDFSSPKVDNSYDGWFPGRAALKDQYVVNYNYSWVFFSEEPVTIKLTPPYMHKTSDSEGGFIPTGMFDISKWFRPINMVYILWKDSSSITVTKDDPTFYVEFLTDKKVVLKQFDMTPELSEIANTTATTNLLLGIQGSSLSERYERFVTSNRHKRVLRLIKENLLE